MQYYFNFKEFEGYKLIEWLYDNRLLSIKDEIISCKISLSTLKQCNKNDIENLLSEMRSKTCDKIKLRTAILNFIKKMEPNKDEDKKTESFYESKYNEMVQENEDLKQENVKLKQAWFS